MNKWGVEFEKVIEDFVYDEVDIDQFRGRLAKLSVPVGYIDWLVYMMTREDDK